MSRSTLTQRQIGLGAQSCSCPCSCRCSQNVQTRHSTSLFEDQEFPARWNILFNPCAAATWMRPHEICQEPFLLTEGRSPAFDVRHDYLEDSWFISACSAIVGRPELLRQVVPEGQVLYGAGYDGSVTFRLWHLGEWRKVRIDDRLPVDGNGVPIYARCKNTDEFWMPLLEKAFAKFHKNYRCVYESNGSTFAEGFSKLTGYSLNMMSTTGFNPDYTFNHLQNQAVDGAVVLCKPRQAGTGLANSHAYTVTQVYNKTLENKSEETKFIRVRSPFGTDSEIMRSERLTKRSIAIKRVMGNEQEIEDDLWMDVKEFCQNFSQIYIGMEKPLHAHNMNMVSQITGHWSVSTDAGGHPDDIEKFARNPQFLLVSLGGVQPVMEGEMIQNNFSSGSGMETVVELVQEHNIQKRSWDYKISCYIFETNTERRLTPEQFLHMNYVTGDSDCIKKPNALCRVILQPGRRYVIVPTTCTPGYGGHFLLRVFSSHARVRLTELPF